MLLTKNISNESSAIFILNPKTGKPYQNKAVLFNRKRYVSDENGKIIVPNSRNYRDENKIEIYVNTVSMMINSKGCWSIQAHIKTMMECE